MKKKVLLLNVFIAILLSTQVMFSQSDPSNPLEPGKDRTTIYFGPVVGYNKSLHTVDLASFVNQPLCPYFTNGNENGFHAGIFYEQFIGEKKNSKHSVIARIMYSTLPASMTQEGDVLPSLIEGSKDPIESAVRHTVDVKYSLLSIDLMYKFNIFKGIVLTAGPNVDIPMTKTLVQKMQITYPDNIKFKRLNPEEMAQKGIVRYEDNDRTIIVKDGDIEDASGARVALKGGLQYEFQTGGKFDIVPGIFYNLALTKVTSSQDWRVNAFQVSVDIRYALTW